MRSLWASHNQILIVISHDLETRYFSYNTSTSGHCPDLKNTEIMSKNGHGKAVINFKNVHFWTFQKCPQKAIFPDWWHENKLLKIKF